MHGQQNIRIKMSLNMFRAP